MITKINGSEATRQLIKTVVSNVRKNKPQNMHHLDYSIVKKFKNKESNLITDEQGGILRNISIVRINSANPFVKGIRAAIGNETGAILLEQKSRLMSTKKAILKIHEFLEDLLPQNRLNPTKVSVQSKTYRNPKYIHVLETNEQFNKNDITTVIDGSNCRWSEEVLDSYKKL